MTIDILWIYLLVISETKSEKERSVLQLTLIAMIACLYKLCLMLEAVLGEISN